MFQPLKSKRVISYALAIYTSGPLSFHSKGLILLENQVKVGDTAPDFTLPDVDMKPRNLKEFLGRKVVLAFFVGAFTETCTKEACEFRDSMSRLVDLNAQVIGIDLTVPFSSKRFAEKKQVALSCFER